MKKKIMLFGIIILFFSPYLQAQVNVIDTVATTTNFPFDLAVNSVGDVYFLEQPAPFFLDQWHQSPDLKVIRHGSSVVETVFSVGEFPSIGSIDGITIDQSDEVYGVSGGNTRIWKLRNSTPVELSNLRQFSSTGFDLAVDQEGNILIPDGNPGLKMFYPDSRRSSTIANGSSGSNGITLSSTGQVYASNLTEGVRGFSLSYGEDGFSRTPSEIIAGGGTDRSLTTAIPAIEADLTCPTPIECKKRLAIDREGNLLIADPGRHVIRKLTSDGLLMTIAGDGEAAYS
ncbi:MAG: hypothetical protein Q7S98_04800 [Deltaproteobacteria bacterium]|nr:hypothetical protein [Deltaproteobacteria bacterium]